MFYERLREVYKKIQIKKMSQIFGIIVHFYKKLSNCIKNQKISKAL